MQHCHTRTFKTLGPWIFPNLFSKPVLCVIHYFSKFYIKADKYFPWFCMNSSFNCIFRFLTVVYILYCFQGPSILTWGTLSHRSHVFQQFPLYLASLVWCHEKIFDLNGSEEEISTIFRQWIFKIFFITLDYIDYADAIFEICNRISLRKRKSLWSRFSLFM